MAACAADADHGHGDDDGDHGHGDDDVDHGGYFQARRPALRSCYDDDRCDGFGDDDDYDDLKGARTCIVSLGSEVSSGDLDSIVLNVTAAPCLQFISSPCCHASHISTSY